MYSHKMPINQVFLVVPIKGWVEGEDLICQFIINILQKRKNDYFVEKHDIHIKLKSYKFEHLGK